MISGALFELIWRATNWNRTLSGSHFIAMFFDCGVYIHVPANDLLLPYLIGEFNIIFCPTF